MEKGKLDVQDLRGPGRGLEHDVPRLADRKPPECMAVEAQRHDLLDGAPAQLGVRGALGDAEEQLSRRALGLALPCGPASSEPHRVLELRARYLRGRDDVETHGDVGAELGLHVRGVLGREARELAVVDRAEGHALLVSLDDRVAQ